MEIEASSFKEIIHINPQDTEIDESSDKQYELNGRSYTIIDNKIGVSNKLFNNFVNKISKIASVIIPLASVVLIPTAFFVPAHFITPIIAAATVGIGLSVKLISSSWIKTSFPYFPHSEIKAEREKLLSDDYQVGDLSKLVSRYGNDPRFLQAYLTSEELESIFKKEVEGLSFKEITENFSVKELHKYELSTILEVKWVKTYAEQNFDPSFIKETDAVKAFWAYAKQLNTDLTLPSIAELSEANIFPKELDGILSSIIKSDTSKQYYNPSTEGAYVWQ